MNYVFIGGCMRTGTTLLQSILCGDGATNPLIPEAQWLARLLFLYKWSMGNFSTLQRHYFRDKDDCRDFHRRICLDFLDKTAERYGNPTTLVLKAPDLATSYKQLNEFVPDSKFLVMVRDPRDTISSILEAKAKFEEKGDPFPFPFHGRDMRQYSRFYNSCYGSLGGKALRPKLMFVKYEALTTNPKPVIDRLREFTGIRLDGFDPDQDWATDGEDGERFKPGIFDEFRTDLFGKALTSKKVARYKADLTDEEIGVIEKECANIMKSFQYEVSG